MRKYTAIFSFVIIAALIFVLASTASLILTYQGQVHISTQFFSSNSEITTAGRLYSPNSWDTSPSKPAIIILHGYGGNKQTMESYSLEFARRGYLTLSLDLEAHGDSGGSYIGILQSQVPMKDDVEAALNFLKSQGAEEFGIIGHSLGAGIALMVANANPEDIDAIGIIGNAFLTHNIFMPPVEYLHANGSSPKNILFAVGTFDELMSVELGMDYFATLLNPSDSSNPQLDTTYGDFSNGTARRFVVAPSTHLLETVNPTFVAESVDWMRNSLIIGNGLSDPLPWIDSADNSDVVFQALLFTITLLLLGLIIPLSILFGTYKDIFPEEEENRFSSKSGLLFFAVIFPTFLIGLLFGSVGMFLGFSIPPVVLGSGLILWFFSATYLFLLVSNKEEGVTIGETTKKILNELSELIQEFKNALNDFNSYLEKYREAFLGIVSGLFFSVLLYVGFLLVNAFFNLQGHILVHIYFPALNTPKILSMLILFILGIPFHYLEAKWIFSPLITKEVSDQSQSLVLQYLRAILLKFSPFLPFSIIVYLLRTVGIPLGIMGSIAWVFFVYMMISTIMVTMSTIFLMNKQNYYTCALFNAFIFAWTVVGSNPWL
ncbi:MAG: alpha/beta hydrolase [Promethearchaeota archaeon]